MRRATFFYVFADKKRNEILQISQPLKKENGHWATPQAVYIRRPQAGSSEAPGREFGEACASLLAASFNRLTGS